MKTSYLAAALIPLAILVSCGGGGGGGGGGSYVPYTGQKSPALLSSDNAGIITEMAIGDAEEIKALSSMLNFSTSPLARASRRTVDTLAKGRTNAFTSTWSEVGNCGGSLDITIDLNERTGAFTSKIKANGYCVDGETLDGSMSSSGYLDQYGGARRCTIEFSPITMIGADYNYSIEGSYGEDFDRQPPLSTLTVNLKDNLIPATYRFENYVFTTLPAEGGIGEGVTGRFYHPAYGYVDLSTESPLVFLNGSDTPSAGTIVLTGANYGRSRFNVISNAAFNVSADLDADGAYDDYSGGVIHFEGKNNSPEVSAGADRIGNIGCEAVDVADATAMDVDTDPLAISWSFISKPEASTAALSGATTLSPSFAPDVKGDYVLELSASDGIGDRVTDTLTVTVYGDLFCLNQKRVVSAALRSHPNAVAVGDVTGDGRNDVVMLTTSDNSLYSDPAQDYRLYVFAQDTAGNVKDPVTYEAGNGGSLVLADFNKDGRLDVAVSDRTGVGVLHQNADGLLGQMQFSSFGETVDPYEPHELLAADFSGDGRPDLVSTFSSFGGARIRLYPQAPEGGLSTPILYTSDPAYWRPLAADAEGDGDLDLFLTSGQLGKGSIYMGAFAKLLRQDSGTLGTPESYLEDKSTISNWIYCNDSLASGKFGAPGNINLAASCTNGISEPEPIIRIYPENSGVAGAASIITARASYSQLAAAEVTGDAHDDLLGMVSGNRMEFDVYRKTPTGLGDADTYPAGMPNYNYSAHAFTVADVNGDGVSDLVAAVYIMPDGGNGIVVIPGNPGRATP